ncbi:MAG: ATP-binding protein [Thermodesulfobacteriota bacterium]|nr:ATP-binding protein [Thermodesulfobacteriota bacterium]
MSSEDEMKNKSKDILGQEKLDDKVVSKIDGSYQNSTRDITIVNRIIDSIRDLPDLSSVCLAIVDIVIDEIDAENCSLMLLNGETNELIVKVAKGKKDKSGRYYDDKNYCGRKFSLGVGTAGMVAKEGIPFLIEDTKEDNHFIDYNDSEVTVRSLLCVPIMDKGRVIGVFNLSHSRVNAFSEKDQMILVIISHLSAMAFVSAFYFEAMKHLNETLEERVKEKTEEVRAYEERYIRLISNANDGIFIIEDGVFTFANKRFLDMVKYSDEELYFKKIEMIFLNDQCNPFFQMINEGTTEGEISSHYELKAIKRDGEKLEVEVGITIIDDDSGKKAIQGIVRDISFRKELESLKSNFLAMAAHELRNPLSLISGYNKMLLNEEVGPLNTFQKKIIQECYKSGKRIHKFSSEFLELSKIEAGKMEFDFQEANINGCIEKALNQIKYLAEEKRIDIKKIVSHNFPLLPLDKDKIERVLVNLLENAIKFNHEGGKVEVKTELASPEVVEVSVTDNGLGIRNEEKEVVFDEFVIGTKRKEGVGTGLGLSICKKIIEAHKGRIWVESEENKGAKFIFALPLSSSLAHEK